MVGVLHAIVGRGSKPFPHVWILVEMFDNSSIGTQMNELCHLQDRFMGPAVRVLSQRNQCQVVRK